MENPRECYETNVTGTIELLEVARQAGIRRVVLASSAAVYGANFDLPQSESAPPDCRSPYAASKQFNETLAKLYSLIFQIPVVALRYFNVYGPRQSPSSPYAAAIPRFVQQLQAGHPPQVFGDGSQTRDFVYVADAVRANLLAAQAPDAEGKVINVCSGIETKLLDLLEVLYRHFPNAPKAEFIDPRIGDVPRSLGNPNEAQKLLGFKAEVGLQEGLKNCVAALSA